MALKGVAIVLAMAACIGSGYFFGFGSGRYTGFAEGVRAAAQFGFADPCESAGDCYTRN